MNSFVKSRILSNVNKKEKLKSKDKQVQNENEIIKKKLWEIYLNSLEYCEKSYSLFKSANSEYLNVGTKDIDLISKCLEELGFKIVDFGEYSFSFVLVSHRFEVDKTDAEQEFKQHSERLKELFRQRKGQIISQCRIVKKMLENGEYSYLKESNDKFFLEVNYPCKYETEEEKLIIYYYFKKHELQFVSLSNQHWNFYVQQ